MQALQIISDAARELQDPEYTRWSLAELASYVTDGQSFVLTKVPSANAQEVELTLTAGSRQTVPSNARKLLDLLRNVGGKQRAIRQVARDLLNASAPGWASGQQRALVVHFVTDPRTPRNFDVYPPVVAGTKVLAVLAIEPTPIADDGATELALRAEFRDAIYHYVMFRAFSKDAEYSANAALAAAHRQLFTDALGIDPGHPMTVDDPTT